MRSSATYFILDKNWSNFISEMFRLNSPVTPCTKLKKLVPLHYPKFDQKYGIGGEVLFPELTAFLFDFYR